MDGQQGELTTGVSTSQCRVGKAMISHGKPLSDKTSILRAMYDVYWAPKGIAVVRT
jgi:hypothetical protein